MVITSDEDYLGGQPRIEGTELSISHVINYVDALGLDDYMREFDIKNKEDIKEAIEYCMNQNCVGNVNRYCNYCSKGKYGTKLWKLAKKLHKIYFNNK